MRASIPRQIVRALLAEFFHSLDMENPPWKQRLADAIKADGRSLASISKSAGLGVNHVQQFLKDEKGPRVDSLLRVCRALEVSPIYILLGLQMDPEAEQLLELLSQSTPEQKQALLAFLRARPRA